MFINLLCITGLPGEITTNIVAPDGDLGPAGQPGLPGMPGIPGIKGKQS